MSKTQKLKGYNSLKDRSKGFNQDSGRKILSQNCNPISDEEKAQAALRLQDLIKKTQSDLNEN
jgi:hypothetical protein